VQLYFDYFKLYSALLVQLRTNRIEFNQFLCEQQIFEIIIETCNCGQKHIIIKYILLVYLK